MRTGGDLRDAMILWPREHGAYGQLILPVVTALSVAGVSAPNLFLTVSAVAGFLAHEPASILVGLRGARARRELNRPAIRWLSVCGGAAVAAGALAFFTMKQDVRWAIAVPLVPALLLGIAARCGREKSWYGEVAAACAFAGLAFPLSMAAGASATTAAAIAIPFVLLFVTSTLAVRSVIVRVRGGGDLRAAASTRSSAVAATGAGAVAVAWLTAIDALPAATLLAAIPGELAALLIVVRPPRPAHLRAIGWTLVGVSVLTAAIVIATL